MPACEPVAVSVILPIYGVAEYLPRCVNALLRQTWREFEVILVDDGSPDESGRICDEFAQMDERIRVIHQKNAGAGAARNAGMDVARGSYLYFCDPDDEVSPTLLEDNLKLAFQHDADMVTFGYRVSVVNRDDTVKRTVERPLPSANVVDDAGFWETFSEELTAGNCIWNRLFRRSMIEQNSLRMNDQTKGEDSTFLYDIYALPPRITVRNPAMYYTYIKREGSLTTTFHPQRMEDEYQTSLAFDRLIAAVPRAARYGAQVAVRYVDCYSAALENLSRDHDLPFGQKCAFARKYYKKAEVRAAIRRVPLGTAKGAFRIKLALLKLGMVTVTVAAQELLERRKTGNR